MDLTTQPYVPPGYGQPGYAGIPGTNNAGGAVDPTTAFIRGLVQAITGAGSLATAGGDMNAARNAANVADPFASQRGQYQPMLHDFITGAGNNPMNAMTGTNAAIARAEGLMNNPGQITSMPGYQFGLDQSLEAVNRAAGSSGLLNSGNRLTALQDRGQGYAHSWYDDVFGQMMTDVNANLGAGNQFLNAQGQGFNQLALTSGATTGSPSAAAQALMLGRQQQAGSIGAGAGGIATGAANMLPIIQRWLSGGGTNTSAGGGAGWGGATPGAANGGWDASGAGGGTGIGTFNPDDWSNWLGQNSSISLGTTDNIFSGVMDAFG